MFLSRQDIIYTIGKRWPVVGPTKACNCFFVSPFTDARAGLVRPDFFSIYLSYYAFFSGFGLFLGFSFFLLLFTGFVLLLFLTYLLNIFLDRLQYMMFSNT